MEFQERRLKLIKETREKIVSSINEDNHISQAIASIGDIDKVANILVKRLRDWYELYYPEFSRKIEDHQRFVEKIIELGAEKDCLGSMGAELKEDDLSEIFDSAEFLCNLYDKKERLTDYIKKKMQSRCPNVLEVCGPLIGAKLLAHKGTLKELAFMPASTVQLLGAEKALFRHLKTNARTPKYGYILQHQDVSKEVNKGKAARQLANKISLAAKKDYFSNSGNEGIQE